MNLKEKFEKYFSSDNAASQTNRKIAIAIACVIGVIAFLLWQDLSKNDFKKPKTTEKLMQGTTPDVGNQNLAAELRDLREEMKKQSNKASIDEEKVKRLIAEQISSNRTELTPADNPFGTPQQGIDGKGQVAPLAPNEGVDANKQASAAPVPNGQSGSVPEANEAAHAKGAARPQTKSGLRTMTDESRNGKAADTINEDQSFLPPGSILSYYLLTGINAPTNIDSNNKNLLSF